MKLLKKCLVAASLVAVNPLFGDAGVSISYRSTPVIVQKNWFNDSNWPEERAYYEGITTHRTLNMVSVSLFFDDSLRGHDDKSPGKYVTKHYVREFEEPSDKYPVGRMIEREVDIGDAETAEEINVRNGWKHGDDGGHHQWLNDASRKALQDAAGDQHLDGRAGGADQRPDGEDDQGHRKRQPLSEGGHNPGIQKLACHHRRQERRRCPLRQVLADAEGAHDGRHGDVDHGRRQDHHHGAQQAADGYQPAVTRPIAGEMLLNGLGCGRQCRFRPSCPGATGLVADLWRCARAGAG